MVFSNASLPNLWSLSTSTCLESSARAVLMSPLASDPATVSMMGSAALSASLNTFSYSMIAPLNRGDASQKMNPHFAKR